MKYWEIVKRLTENPALSGVAVIGSTRYELYVDNSRTLQSATHYTEVGLNGTSLGKAANIDFDGWEIVHQPVTWQEAIEAWADGKTIKTQSDDGIRTYRKTSKGLQSVLGGVTKDELLNGTWYVED